MTLPDMPIRAVQTFSHKGTADTFTFDVEVPTIDPENKPVAFLVIHSLVTSTKTDDYTLEALADEQLPLTQGGTVSHTTANRRFVASVFYSPLPAEGLRSILISTSRAVNSLVAFFCVVERVDVQNPLIKFNSAAGNADKIELPWTLEGGLCLYSVQSRRGHSDIQPRGETNVKIDKATADPDDNQREVSAALMASTLSEGDTLLVAEATPSPSGLNLLLAVELRRFEEEPPDPPDEPDPPAPAFHELSIIVRDIPPGGLYEVRFVKPGTFVYDEDGYIDWDATPFTGFVMVGQEEPVEGAGAAAKPVIK